MHISDGVLRPSVYIGGYLASTGIMALCVNKMKSQELPKVAVVTSAFFIASLIHIPLGPTSVHLLIIGLVGALLGVAAFPAVALGYARLVQRSDVRQERNGPGAFDGGGQRPLMFGAGTGDPSGDDFPAFGNKIPKGSRFLVIDGHGFVRAETADFTPMKKAFPLSRIRSFPFSSAS